jgi:hypothetical protein
MTLVRIHIVSIKSLYCNSSFEHLLSLCKLTAWQCPIEIRDSTFMHKAADHITREY